MFNKYPYTNFHELNLEYFIKHFEEIFDQWQELYTELQSWKNSTTEELEAWKTEVENGIADEQARVLAELEAWKTETGEDIDDWETSVLTALNSWKSDFETLFATTFANLTQIKTDAETARDAAQAAQGAAEDAQEAAEDAADSVSASAAQITQNAGDIANLKSQLNQGKTATQGYILTATDEGIGTQWSPVGLPTDAQTAEAVSNWLNEHPEATTTVQDNSITTTKLADTLKTKVGVIITTASEFETALSENTYDEYVCGEITFNTPIMLSTDKLGNKKRFVNGTFTLNDTMFTSSSIGAVREIPAFTNCTFIGNGNAICDEGFYTQYGIFVNCIFIDCAFVNGGRLIQSAHFIGCKVINTTVDFITTGRIIDTRFDHVIIDNDNTRAFLKAGQAYYPSETGAHISATNISFAHFMVEGQSVTPIEVCDCNISFTDLYSEALADGLIKINDSAIQNSRLNLYFLNCRLQAQSGVYVVNVNSSDYDGARDTAVTVRSCVVNNSEFINKTNFRIYNTDDVAPINNGHFIPSKELSGIKTFSNNNRNSVITFKPVTADGQTTYHAVVRKFPCLFDVKFQFNSPTRVISLLFFVDKYSDNYYQCDCLNNNSNLTFTSSIDQDGNVDIEFEKAWFTASNTFGLFLMGQENILSIDNYYRSQFESGYLISDT